MLWDTTFNSILINVLSLLISVRVQRSFEGHPQRQPAAYIIPISLTVYAVSFALLLVTRSPYSIKALLLGLAFTPFFLSMLHVLRRKDKDLRFVVIPFGAALNLMSSDHYKFKLLKRPILPKGTFNGVVVDFRSSILTSEWEQFLAQCALMRIPVYNAMQLNETITGKVNVEHLAENHFGDLMPSRMQIVVKRFLDVFFLLLISPVLLPLMFSIAFWIIIDSPGGAFFVQRRMGLSGNYFNVVKFRSMTVDHGGSHFTEADERDRITKVGKIIRKYRLDELPQFWNVLRGEMSLIGPRPESAELAKWYEKDVPFFAYRHVVRPGISGWAQVMHGYAAGVDEMKEKLAYDFYYIKHFSLWLDLLIWYKTIRTVVTGFGSR
jgi:lipopolysaccharide/colanic/teichoic acid biosynthesis glycosyltransferase